MLETRRISAIKIGKRHRKDLGDLESLAESFKTAGMLHAIVIDSHDRLIAGQRRLEAAKRLGWREVPVRVVDLEQIALGEFVENACRKDFTPSEIAAVAKALRPSEEKKAHQRKLAGLHNQKVVVENCHHEGNGKTRDLVARYTGISGRTLNKIEAICDAVEKEPKLYGHLKEEMDAEPRAVHRCYQKLKAIRQQQSAREDTVEPVQIGNYKLKENQIVCADCRELLPKIKANTFHAIITDSTFGIGHDYNGKKEAADDPEGYWKWFEPIYREMLRALKPGGFCAIFQARRYMRHFWDWYGPDITIYAACKEPTAGVRGGRPLVSCWWPVVCFFKGGRPAYPSSAHTRSRNWFVSNSKFDDLAKVHSCPEPLDQC